MKLAILFCILKFSEPIAHYNQGLQIQPVTWAYHNFLHALHYSPDFDPVTIFFEHKQFNKRFAVPLATSIQPHHNDPNSQRQLRIGYISQDFRNVGVARFIEAFLAHHDRQLFEIFCYYNHPVVDDKTQ